MNKVIEIGRLTKDPEIRYSNIGDSQERFAIARYTLAVERITRDANGDRQADFIPCRALGKNGEFAEKYLKKGMKVAVEGEIRTGSYQNKDGQTVYTTEVLVNHHEFCEKKSAADSSEHESNNPADGFMPIPDGLNDEELPFA